MTSEKIGYLLYLDIISRAAAGTSRLLHVMRSQEPPISAGRQRTLTDGHPRSILPFLTVPFERNQSIVALPVVLMKPLPPDTYGLEKRDEKKISGRKIKSIFSPTGTPV